MKQAKHNAIELHSKIIRSIGECERCYSTESLTCAHIIKRRFSNTVTDLRNGICLCITCHRYLEDHPREFSRFISDTWAEQYYDAVYAKSQEVGKINWDDEYERLKEIKKRLATESLDSLRGEEE